MPTIKPLFDDHAHSIITGLLDASEHWLVRTKRSAPQSANDYMCRDFIATCSGIIWGATVFLDSDERIGTELFLERLNGAKSKLRSPRVVRRCAEHLVRFPQAYFPNYLTMLRVMYFAELPKLETKAIIRLNGILKLAAANLPGVRNDVRRELRRRGAEYESTIVHDDTLDRKLARFKDDLLPMTLDKPEDWADQRFDRAS